MKFVNGRNGMKGGLEEGYSSFFLVNLTYAADLLFLPDAFFFPTTVKGTFY